MLAAVYLHARVAERRSNDRLLEHDEAISLLAAAGKSDRIDSFYEHLDQVQVWKAGEVASLLHPTEEAGISEVFRSLGSYDIHPPLYFTSLHVLQRLGIDSQLPLRLFGTLLLCIAAIIANRWLWPDAPIVVRLMATAWLVATPVAIDFATELRQYGYVLLGTVLSLVALLRFAQPGRSERQTLIITAIAPVILLWSHYGTVLWVGLCLLTMLVGLIWSDQCNQRSRRRLGLSVLLAVVLLVPLVIWRMQGYVDHGRPPPMGTDLWYPNALRPVLSAIGQAWCSMPDRLRFSSAWPIAGVIIIVSSGIIAFLRPSRIDRVLWILATVWGITWVVLLTLSVLPPHAIEPKQLLPLVLCPLVLLARATTPDNSKRIRMAATTLLVASLASHTLGVVQQATRPHQPSVDALRAADCLIVSSPKRGYLLPLAAVMRPEATLIIAPPDIAIKHWPLLEKHLPEGRLLYAEIDISPDRRSPSCETMLSRLAGSYAVKNLLRKEPKKTILEYRHRLAMPKADRED